MNQSPQGDGRGEAKHTDLCVKQKRTSTEAGSKGWIGVMDDVKYGGREEKEFHVK